MESIFGMGAQGLGAAGRRRGAAALAALACLWGREWPESAPLGAERGAVRPDDPDGLAERVAYALGALERRWPEHLEGELTEIGIERVSGESLRRALRIVSRFAADSESMPDYSDPIERAFGAEGLNERLGQFFTPPSVALANGLMVEPRAGEWVCDPACGAGALLRGAARALRAGEGGVELARTATFIGVDLDPECVIAARLTLICEGLAEAAHVFRGDGLRQAIVARDPGTGNLRELRFPVLLANPPFGGAKVDARELAPLEPLVVPERLVARPIAIPRELREEAIAAGLTPAGGERQAA
jgi:hypothetical protein